MGMKRRVEGCLLLALLVISFSFHMVTSAAEKGNMVERQMREASQAEIECYNKCDGNCSHARGHLRGRCLKGCMEHCMLRKCGHYSNDDECSRHSIP